MKCSVSFWLGSFLLVESLHGSEAELARALERAEASGAMVLLAIVEDHDASALDRLGTNDAVERVVVTARSSPRLVARFGADRLPLFVLLDKSGEELGRAVDERPDAPGGLAHLTEPARRRNDARKRLTTAPRDLEAHYWLGAYHQNRGETLRAGEHFRKVLEVVAARTHSGQPLHLDVRQDRMAQEARRRVLEEFLNARRLPEAEALLHQVDLATRLDEHGDWAALQLALLLRRRGQTEKAMSILRDRCEVRRDAPAAARLLFTLAYMERESGQQRRARETFAELRDRFPGSLYGLRAARHMDEEQTSAIDVVAPVE